MHVNNPKQSRQFHSGAQNTSTNQKPKHYQYNVQFSDNFTETHVQQKCLQTTTAAATVAITTVAAVANITAATATASTAVL